LDIMALKGVIQEGGSRIFVAVAEDDVPVRTPWDEFAETAEPSSGTTDETHRVVVGSTIMHVKFEQPSDALYATAHPSDALHASTASIVAASVSAIGSRAPRRQRVRTSTRRTGSRRASGTSSGRSGPDDPSDQDPVAAAADGRWSR
jgi:hypothetical protein